MKAGVQRQGDLGLSNTVYYFIWVTVLYPLLYSRSELLIKCKSWTADKAYTHPDDL